MKAFIGKVFHFGLIYDLSMMLYHFDVLEQLITDHKTVKIYMFWKDLNVTDFQEETQSFLYLFMWTCDLIGAVLSDVIDRQIFDALPITRIDTYRHSSYLLSCLDDTNVPFERNIEHETF